MSPTMLLCSTLGCANIRLGFFTKEGAERVERLQHTMNRFVVQVDRVRPCDNLPTHFLRAVLVVRPVHEKHLRVAVLGDLEAVLVPVIDERIEPETFCQGS